jgi:hypothetical protein
MAWRETSHLTCVIAERSEKSTRRRVTPREKKKTRKKTQALDGAPLHPSLAKALDETTGTQTDAKTLAACVPRDRVRKWAEHCARALAQFEADGDRIRAVVGDVAQRVGTRVGAAAAQARADALDAVEADAAVCAALAQRQAALVEALGRDERDASDLVAKHCVDDPSVGDLADDPTSSPRAQFDLDLSGDNVLKGSLLDDDDDEADDQFGTPTKSSAVALDACRELQARWERRERLLPIIKATERSIAQCARSCASRADALATRSLEELRGVGELQTTIHDAQANHLETHSDALEAKARAFAQLDTVRALPRVHAALCLEVARRRSYGTAAAAVVQKATEDVARLREVDPPAPFTPTFAPDERELPCISVEDLREDGAPRPRADSSDSALAPPNQASSHHSSDVAMEEKEGSSSEDDDHDDDDEQALRAKCARLECELAALRAEACEEKPRAVSAEDVSEAEEGPPQISFRRFELGDVALFLPTGAGDGRKSYLAFHHGCPHRYLAPSSVEAIRAAHQRYPDFILGRVTRCDAREASDADNPFRLPPGTAFHVLTVESL